MRNDIPVSGTAQTTISIIPLKNVVLTAVKPNLLASSPKTETDWTGCSVVVNSVLAGSMSSTNINSPALSGKLCGRRRVVGVLFAKNLWSEMVLRVILFER